MIERATIRKESVLLNDRARFVDYYYYILVYARRAKCPIGARAPVLDFVFHTLHTTHLHVTRARTHSFMAFASNH